MNYLLDALLPRERSLDQPCLLRPDGVILTYGDLQSWSSRYAAALSRSGVRPGDRVIVQVEKSPDALFLYLACLRAGGIFLPLNTAYTPAELAYFIKDAEPSLVVGRPELERTLLSMVGAGVKVLTMSGEGRGSLPDLAHAESDSWIGIERSGDDLATILYTSGTTGRSKGAMLTHANLRANAEALVRAWEFSLDDVLLHALPIFHAHGLYVGINVTLLAGARMIFLPHFEAAEVIRHLSRATVMMGVPTFYTRLLNEPALSRELAGGVRVFISGSAPLLAETHAEFRRRTGHEILERYGMTETSMNTSNPYRGRRVPGSVGLPLGGVSVRVTDLETGETLPANEIGMIEVSGPNVFKGYWKKQDTANEFRHDGFFVTGDIGRIDENSYLWILGRGKDMIISGGYNVYPKEVEAEIDSLEGVLESAVIGVPHRDYGEAVVAVVVPKQGANLAEANIIDPLRHRLAGYKLPKKVAFLPELPRNTMGKVQKDVLKREYRRLLEPEPVAADLSG